MAEAETPDNENKLRYRGRTFRKHPDGVSEFAQLEFAEAATSGRDDNMADMAALYRLVIDSVHPEDQAAFRLWARECRATLDELTELLMTGTAGDERPTEAPSPSMAGRTDTDPKSESLSTEPATQEPGRTPRPDLLHLVLMEEKQQGPLAAVG